MNKIDASELLQQMHSLADIASGKEPRAIFAEAQDTEDSFTDALKGAVSQVNDLQAHSGDLQKRYDMEDPNVSLSEVMVAMQKSSVSFQALTQVRNKFVSAYQDIMNMQV